MTRSTGSKPPEPAPRLRADARRNRDRLLAAAHEAFTEHGADASLDDIARRAGVGIGTLYRHFPTRDALLVATLEDRLAALGEKGRTLLDAPAPGEALVTWLKAMVKHATTYRGLAGTVLAMLQGATGVTAACDQAHTVGTALLARAQAAGEARPHVDYADVVSMVTAIAFAAQQPPRDPARERRLLAMVLDGLRTGEPRAK